VWGFLGWVLLSLFWYMLSLGIVTYIVSPLVKFGLIRLFEYLPRYGAAHTLRQAVALPIVAMLSRERHVRRRDRGYYRSLLQLFMFELVGAFVVSVLIQGFLTTIIYTLIFAVLAYWVCEVKLRANSEK
jgi:hypothetical protein